MLFDSFFSSFNEQERLFNNFLERHSGKFFRILDVFPNSPEYDAEYIRSVAEIKRFLEVYTGKIEIRNQCKLDSNYAQKVIDELGLDISSNKIRIIWDSDLIRNIEGSYWMAETDDVLRHRCFIQEKINHRAELQQIRCVPQNERLKIWRRRQMERLFTEVGFGQARSMIHAPLIFELSDGCSVGCWFCGVNAKKKGEDFLYTRDNIKLWRDTLEFFNDFLGKSAGTGTCYYGTEPFDNPDYELFCDDFADILGTFPQTTTAVALRDVERTRRLLKHSRERGTKINRFSILSEKILDEVHAAFTPEELLYTELLTQNFEASSGISHAGRAREHKELFQKKEKLTGTAFPTEPASICCISGFRLNMVRKTIDILTPCGANEKYPLGEWHLASGSFNTVADIEKIVRDWTENVISVRLLPRNLVAFRPDIAAELSADSERLLLKIRSGVYAFKNKLNPFILKLVQAGNLSAYQIAEQICQQDTNISLEDVFEMLNLLFQDGFLDESPEFFAQHRFNYSKD
ncbi:MAG: radical SAM family RiPP maturation amino acid epimerase [Planctomycetaceae bacterium]|jgi:radical SAM family RiPP maturation amino acid epimerase|nr:radical SAM family RiPP maturation amino acid epimerase [Planctomycetaceae bacterium]